MVQEKSSDTTLPEQIAARLRRDILRGRLAPGAPIKERDTSAEMGVSRTPLREAIRILAKEGLIELRPARSPIVTVPSVHRVSDDAEMLLALEKLSARLACERATDAEIAEIATQADLLEAASAGDDPLDRFEIDMRFHSAIAASAHNARLLEMHRSLLARLWHLRYLVSRKRRNRERAVAHHRAIARAIASRDPAGVERALDDHLGILVDDMIEVLDEQLAQIDTPAETGLSE